MWKDAERAELRALAIDPHSTVAAVSLVNIPLSGAGDVDSARRAFDRFPEDVKGRIIGERLGQRGQGGGGGNLLNVLGIAVYLDVIQRHFTDAFQAFEKQIVNNDRERLDSLAGRVILCVLAGQSDGAKSTGEQARPLLEARLKEQPDDTLAMTQLSWAYLALGRNADAIRVSKQAADLISVDKDAVIGPSFQHSLAQIEARADAPEEAIKRLRRLLSIPVWSVSIARLKIDPVWDPIRNRPDFQQLLSGPEKVGPGK
jgi:tetratricopeptide (TPR) repeat protein